jgi:hypothetical protein
MTVSIDTLRALADVDPFKQGRAPLGRGDECLARLDSAGLLPYMARTNKTGSDLNNYLWYYQSKDGHEYQHPRARMAVDTYCATRAQEDLARLAQSQRPAGSDLASPDEVIARRNRGRMM